MKIGQVVRKYGITTHSIYFYINNGLLVPPRRNNQYVFDQRTLEELELILKLKEMAFPLKTIHRVLSLRRISNFYSEEDREELKKIYMEQNRLLKEQEESIHAARHKLLSELSGFENSLASGQKTGVSIEMLSMLRCPDCGNELMLEDVSMSQKYIFRGKLSCTCGYCAYIRDGIIETGNVNTSLYDQPDVTRELYRGLPSETLSLFEKSYRCLEDEIDQHVGAKTGRVWLESYVNAWFFFHNHLELLHENDCLIVVDKFPETLRAYKAIIERAGVPCNILYIADCSFRLPLKRGLIDCNMDFFAVNEHNFYHDGLFLDQLLPYLKQDAHMFGVYFYFENGANSMKKLMSDYPESSRDNFNVHWFNHEINRNFYALTNTDCGSARVSGNNLGLGFHVPGDVLHLQAYYGRVR